MKEMPGISPIERLLNERLLQNLRSASLYTEEFIKLEKEGIQESKRLVKESSGYYHGVFKVLLDSMIRDSEKHIELLEFLKENLKET
jgi:hypothetical protein